MFKRNRYPRYLILEQPRPQVGRWWKAFKIISLLLFMLVSVLLFIAASSARAQPLPEVGAGELLMNTGQGGWQPALQLHTDANIQVRGMVARVELTQRFKNTGAEWAEGVYAFPLPDDAAVNYLEMRVGERRIIGEIKEKQEALKIYQKARIEGKKASLVEQQRPNLFTNKLANVGPGETVEIRLRYIQQVQYGQGQFSLRYPMTITPRYIPGLPLTAEFGENYHLSQGMGWAHNTDQVPDASHITPPQLPDGGPTISVSVQVDMGLPLDALDALHHEMQLEREGHVYKLAFKSAEELMNRDLQLQWRVRQGKEPRAAFFSERLEEDHFGLLMVVPPLAKQVELIKREVIFVIDTSGSMGGISIVQARGSVQFGLKQLQPGDTFNIIEFNDRARSLFPHAVPATASHLARASEYVRQLQAGGGTEMLPALGLALAGGNAGERLRQVVFITDGAVGNEMALFRSIQARLGHSRLFTVGIGSAPNSWFMRKAAEVGRGQARFIGDLTQVQQEMQALFSSISQPLAMNLRVNWPDQTEPYPAVIPDLYAGEPLLVSVRLPARPAGQTLSVSGRIGGRAWHSRIGLGDAAESSSGIATLWARKRIEDILDRKITGASEEQVRADVLPVALKHQLVSPYTSFVAVEERISRPLDAALNTKALPNARPAGQSPQPFAYPATATGWLAQLLFALALLCTGLLARWRWA